MPHRENTHGYVVIGEDVNDLYQDREFPDKLVVRVQDLEPRDLEIIYKEQKIEMGEDLGKELAAYLFREYYGDEFGELRYILNPHGFERTEKDKALSECNYRLGVAESRLHRLKRERFPWWKKATTQEIYSYIFAILMMIIVAILIKLFK